MTTTTLPRSELIEFITNHQKLIRGFCHLAIGQVSNTRRPLLCWTRGESQYRTGH